MALTSTRNAQLQSVRKAAASGRPTEESLVVIEGPHLLEEVLGSAWTVERVYSTPKAMELHSALMAQVDAEVIEVAAPAFSSIAATESSQEILALVRPKTWTLPEVLRGQSLVVVLDGMQDPGNAGTIIRSSEAFGAGAAVLLKGCVRSSNGKFLRAAAGSLFRLPYAEGTTTDEFVQQAEALHLRIYSLTNDAEQRIETADFRRPCALVAGGEGAGVSPELLARSEPVSIPTRRVESLNAAVACSIALFEVQRQRSTS